ncbi:hypothetical protein SAMD00019534_000050 [Acytostelium subglobosum LB1]|uniref:hypothetical protein n=1 Tax=Acytostelium subglobosum LB1 TaxID=1410327 RepID=UPI00064499F6|nr:hypothetical protein SAMD00019534_000050 [Acytostelium subglobosum LB1]GAM16830.1 hypothetical protein SAMD00019534_000050 [Acytostelium subglobosum LB1]|eukprot:XP_012758892.1 hypothetical protein SAMD00019534_000050 [Acytostelium subglobosum LB1]
MGISKESVRTYLQYNLFDSLRLVDKTLFKQKLVGLAIGQIVSLCITGTGVFSQLLVINYNVNIPTAQSLLNYILLMFYSIVLIKRGTFWHSIKTKTIFLLPLAFIDVEANYLAVKAYQYTSITSAMLLDCWTIPCVVVLTRIFLKTRYTLVQVFAVVLSISGMVLLVVSDLLQGESANGGSNPLLGDMFVIIASCLYAISNVGQEFTVKKYDQYTYLALVGIYGSIISAIQLSIFERNELQTMVWNGEVVGYIIAFALCLFAMYSVVPHLMRIAGSTLMNLSILTADIYSVIIAIFLFDRKLNWLFYLSLVVITSALAIYNLTQPHYKSEEVLKLKDLESAANNEEEEDTQPQVEEYQSTPMSVEVVDKTSAPTTVVEATMTNETTSDDSSSGENQDNNTTVVQQDDQQASHLENSRTNLITDGL